MGVGYRPGNTSDIIKHSNLECFVDSFGRVHTYVEFHSGEGRYGEYEGSALRVLRMLNRQHVDYCAYLHEVRPSARSELAENVSGYPDVAVLGNWRSSVTTHVATADEKTLFLFDPTDINDYVGEDGLLVALGGLLSKGSSIFMYVPQSVHQDGHIEIVAAIRETVRHHGSTGVDLMHPVENKGWFKRIDHDIIVGPVRTLDSVVENHHSLCGQMFASADLKDFELVRKLGRWDYSS
jgi:hypothetical protein